MNKILSIIILSIVLFVSVQYAEAEQLLLEGENKKNGIFIAIEGKSNIMMWETSEGYSEHFDSKQKIYKSGGFSLKNPESGIAVWGHPLSDTQYKLVILTSEGVSRIVADVISMDPVETVTKSGAITERIEPKSSVGADVTKWDIPTNNSRTEEKSMLIGISGDRIEKLRLGSTYEKTFKIKDVRSNTPLVGADVTLEISRDGFVHKKIVTQTSQGGLIHFKIQDLDYPLFYPRFCYDIEIVTTVGDVTQTWSDDFLMEYKLGSRIWDPNMNWMSESRWNYLPSSFTDEPRQSILADSHCN